MPDRLDKKTLLSRLRPLFAQAGLVPVHPDAPEPTARAALESLAGLPPGDELWVGDLGAVVALVLLVSGERLPGVELARRAELVRERNEALSKRVRGPVQALQLVSYERPVPSQERDFILSRARKLSAWPFARGKVASWVFALEEPALHSGRFPKWPRELGPDELRRALVSPAADQARAMA